MVGNVAEDHRGASHRWAAGDGHIGGARHADLLINGSNSNRGSSDGGNGRGNGRVVGDIVGGARPYHDAAGLVLVAGSVGGGGAAVLTLVVMGRLAVGGLVVMSGLAVSRLVVMSGLAAGGTSVA